MRISKSFVKIFICFFLFSNVSFLFLGFSLVAAAESAVLSLKCSASRALKTNLSEWSRIWNFKFIFSSLTWVFSRCSVDVDFLNFLIFGRHSRKLNVYFIRIWIETTTKRRKVRVFSSTVRTCCVSLVTSLPFHSLFIRRLQLELEMQTMTKAINDGGGLL